MVSRTRHFPRLSQKDENHLQKLIERDLYKNTFVFDWKIRPTFTRNMSAMEAYPWHTNAVVKHWKELQQWNETHQH